MYGELKNNSPQLILPHILDIAKTNPHSGRRVRPYVNLQIYLTG